MSATLAPFLLTPLLDLFILTAHIFLPAHTVDGYIQDDKGKPLKYRLNGPLVLAVTVLSWATLCATGFLPWDYLYTHYGETLGSACITGVLCTVYFISTGDKPPPHPLEGGPPSPGWLADFFLGRTLNPRFQVSFAGQKQQQRRVVDVKMALYIVGAVHLELNVLSSVAAQYAKVSTSSPHASTNNNNPNPGILLAAAFFTFFVSEYLYWENVHLYTYDIFAERIGFKLVWGCLCFYPFFYPIGVVAGVASSLANPRSNTAAHLHGTGYYVFAAAVFFAGWGVSRGANLQKYWFKIANVSAPSTSSSLPDRKRATARRGQWGSQILRSRDGSKVLYCGGLWALARHINYVGEILEAVGIALAVGYPASTAWLEWLPWLYPVYYVGLLVARERDDDKRCREKYGALWDEYCQRVPWRLIPFVY